MFKVERVLKDILRSEFAEKKYMEIGTEQFMSDLVERITRDVKALHLRQYKMTGSVIAGELMSEEFVQLIVGAEGNKFNPSARVFYMNKRTFCVIFVHVINCT